MSSHVLNFNRRVADRVNSKLEELATDIAETLSHVTMTEEEAKQKEEAEWQAAADLAEERTNDPRNVQTREWLRQSWPDNYRRRRPGWRPWRSRQ